MSDSAELMEIIDINKYLVAPNVQQQLTLSRDDLIAVVLDAYVQRQSVTLQRVRDDLATLYEQQRVEIDAFLEKLGAPLSDELNKRVALRVAFERAVNTVRHNTNFEFPALVLTLKRPTAPDLMEGVVAQTLRTGITDNEYQYWIKPFLVHLSWVLNEFFRDLRAPYIDVQLPALRKDGINPYVRIDLNFTPELAACWAGLCAIQKQSDELHAHERQVNGALTDRAVEKERNRISVEIARGLLAQHGVLRNRVGVE